MQKSVMDFTARLQDAEVEKKSLRAYAERYREERNQIKMELQSERAQIVSVQMAERQYKNKVRFSHISNKAKYFLKYFETYCFVTFCCNDPYAHLSKLGYAI